MATEASLALPTMALLSSTEKGLHFAHVEEHLRAAHARRRLRHAEFILQRNPALRKGLQRQQKWS